MCICTLSRFIEDESIVFNELYGDAQENLIGLCGIMLNRFMGADFIADIDSRNDKNKIPDCDNSHLLE